MKISSAVKLSKDPTKSINPDESISVITKSIPLAEGADDIAKILIAAQKKELQNVAGRALRFHTSGVFDKDWEAWGQIHFNGLNYKANISDGTSEGVHTVLGPPGEWNGILMASSSLLNASLFSACSIIIPFKQVI